MMRWLFILAFLGGTAALALGYPPHKANFPSEAFTAHCTAIDGDTLRCGEDRIRLLGVDAAELPGHCRQERDCAPGDPNVHWAELGIFAASGDMTIQPVKTDRYGRIVAIVTDAAGNNASCAALGAGARYVRKWDYQYRIWATCLLEEER